MDLLEHQCHSLEQLAFLKELSGKGRLPTRQALYLATQLVNHGAQGIEVFLRNLRDGTSSTAVREYVDRLMLRYQIIQALPALVPLRQDTQAVRQLYDTEGFVFRRGGERPDVAVVIFTTKFNNFSFSNLVSDAIFSELGVSRLVLKDCTDLLYFGGVKGLAGSLDELPGAIARLLASHGVRHVIFTGYSSGGYASLYVATRIKSLGYIGFSVATNISPQSPLPDYPMYDKPRGLFDKSLFRDLRPDVEAQPGTRFLLHYGQRDPVDRAHAEYLGDLANVGLTGHDSADHQVTVHLLEEGRFTEPFIQLLASQPAR